MLLSTIMQEKISSNLVVNEEYEIFFKHEFDCYTNEKYYILYVILYKQLIMNLLSITELIDEDKFILTFLYKNGETLNIEIPQKKYNKEFTFLRKKFQKNKHNFVIRVSNDKKIVNYTNQKDLMTHFFFIDL